MYNNCEIRDQDYNNMILKGLKFIVIKAAVRYIQYAVYTVLINREDADCVKTYKG